MTQMPKISSTKLTAESVDEDVGGLRFSLTLVETMK